MGKTLRQTKKHSVNAKDTDRQTDSDRHKKTQKIKIKTYTQRDEHKQHQCRRHRRTDSYRRRNTHKETKMNSVSAGDTDG